MLGVSHGALQFMTYEEMKNAYNQYRKLPIDSKLVSCINNWLARDDVDATVIVTRIVNILPKSSSRFVVMTPLSLAELVCQAFHVE